MKKILALLLVLTMALSLAACGGAASDNSSGNSSSDDSAKADDKIVIGLTLMDYNFPFFQDMLASAKKTAEENGATIVDLDGAGDVQKQLQGVEDMIAGSEIDGLFLNPVDSEAIGPATLEANDANIPVVTVDVRSGLGEVVAHVASNNLDIGRTAANYAVELLKAKYNGEVKGTAIVMGYPQITSIKDRADGFLEVMAKYPNVKVVEIAPTALNILTAQSLWDDTMQSYPEGSFDVVYGSNATNICGIIAATEAAGRTDFDAIGVDNDQTILDALAKKSFLAATVVQSPVNMGKLGVETLIKAIKGEKIDNTEVATTLQLVTRDNFDEYQKTNEAEQASIADWKE